MKVVLSKIINIGEKRGRRAKWQDQHVNDLTEIICENNIISHRKTKRSPIKLLKNLTKSMNAKSFSV